MKKLLSLFIVLVMVITVLTGCGKVATGTDLAKLMLANQRLNAQLLKNDGNIFESGAETLRNVANYTKSTLNQDSTLVASTDVHYGLMGDKGGKLEVTDGTTFTWSEFEETSNMVSYIDSYAKNIIASAERGAQMIENFKKKVSIVDQWVRAGRSQFLLHVEENSETLIEKSGNQVDVCQRTRNENGDDVYQVYVSSNFATTHMTYIKGKHLELSMLSNGDGSCINIIATNDKGYWEAGTFDYISDRDGDAGNAYGYNIGYIVMKDDLCYTFMTAIDSFDDGGVRMDANQIDIVSADNKTDIFSITNDEMCATVLLKFSGFNGIDNVTITVSPDEIGTDAGWTEQGDKVRFFEEEYAVLDVSDTAVINLVSGTQLKVGQTYADGKVEVGSFHVGHGAEGYTGYVTLRLEGNSYQQRMAALLTFFSLTGLQCRRDVEPLMENVLVAYDEKQSVVDNFVWKGHKTNSLSELDAAMDVVRSDINEFDALYQSYKDAPVVSSKAYSKNYQDMDFAKVEDLTSTGVVVDGRQVSVESISLKATDSMLVMAEETYKVGIALANANGLVHVDTQAVAVAPNGSTASVSAQNVSFELPVLASGNYNLVAYVCTADGIRISEYKVVAINSATQGNVTVGNVQISTDASQNVVIYQGTIDAKITLAFATAPTFEQFYGKVTEFASVYGVLSTKVEQLVDGNYKALSGTETAIASGTYRVAYKVVNGNNSKQGYVYVEVK